jgi:hypothetical protein
MQYILIRAKLPPKVLSVLLLHDMHDEHKHLCLGDYLQNILYTRIDPKTSDHLK